MENNLRIYLDKDIDTNLIKTKKIAVIGFGSQGYGQSMNLKESGCDVVLGLRLGGKSDIKAKDYGFKTMSIEDAVRYADIVQILIPDEIQSIVYEEQIKPNMRDGQYLMFSHGFNIHFKKIVPPDDINVIMVAPKGPGHTVRSQYTEGKGVPSLIAVYQNPSGDGKEVALSYASAIGAGRAGIIETTFREETERKFKEMFPELSFVSSDRRLTRQQLTAYDAVLMATNYTGHGHFWAARDSVKAAAKPMAYLDKTANTPDKLYKALSIAIGARKR